MLGLGVRKGMWTLLLAAVVACAWGAARADAYVYFTAQFGLARANMDAAVVNPTFVGVSTPYGVAVSPTHVWWATPGAINRANLDGTGVSEPLFGTAGGFQGAGVAVDAGHVYWVNPDSNSIGRANLDGTGASPFFISVGSPGHFIYSVAVNATNIFWADQTTNTIGRANLDGTAVNTSFITNSVSTQGVAVDGRNSVAPTITTDPASGVTSTSANLNVTIHPGGESTTYKYEHGPTTAFGTLVPASGTLNGGKGFVAVSQPAQAISGLKPATTYYYRACGNNLVTGTGVANQRCGAVRSLTTPGGPTAPSATTGAASSVTNTTAQLAR